MGLAEVHHWVIAIEQLSSLGFTTRRVQRLVGARVLHRVHHGVYAVGRRS